MHWSNAEFFQIIYCQIDKDWRQLDILRKKYLNWYLVLKTVLYKLEKRKNEIGMQYCARRTPIQKHRQIWNQTFVIVISAKFFCFSFDCRWIRPKYYLPNPIRVHFSILLKLILCCFEVLSAIWNLTRLIKWEYKNELWKNIIDVSQSNP